jgi:predicted Fe-Mo cluster-binding NifX family protein
LEAQVEPRFGRCPYFVVVDPDTLEFEAVENPNEGAVGGAGVQSGQLVASKGAQAVLTGNVGPNALQTLQAAGIVVYTGVSGSVKEAIDGYKAGELKPTQGPTVGPKHGIPPRNA